MNPCTEKLNRLIEKDWGLIAQKLLDRRELEKKGDFGNFEELRENEIHLLMPIAAPSVLSAVHLPAAGDTPHIFSIYALLIRRAPPVYFMKTRGRGTLIF